MHAFLSMIEIKFTAQTDMICLCSCMADIHNPLMLGSNNIILFSTAIQFWYWYDWNSKLVEIAKNASYYCACLTCLALCISTRVLWDGGSSDLVV